MAVGSVGSNNYDYQYNQNSEQAASTNQEAQAQDVTATQETATATATGETTAKEEASSTAATQQTEAAEETEGVRTSDELCAGKSTKAGDVDYFDGASVITDADAVVDIAQIMHDNKASNMSPSKLAGLLSEKGYNVQVVKMGNREAVRFENGDFFYDSDGDGNLGTKDQNFKSALTMVEQNYGVDLSELKNSKYTAYHKYSEIGKNKDLSNVNVSVLKTFGAFEGRDLNFEAQNKGSLTMAGQGGFDEVAGLADHLGELNEAMAAEAENMEQATETNAILDDLDDQLQAAGYRGDKSAYDLWMDGELSEILGQFEIQEPSLPETGNVMAGGMALFGAAMSVAAAREA